LLVWGDDLFEKNSSPRRLKSLEGKKIKEIDSTALTTVVLTHDNCVYQWTIEKVFFPFSFCSYFQETQLTLVATQELNICQISCGGSHTLLLNKDGNVFSYGSKNKYGQLGHGDEVTVEEPTQIKGVKDIVSMACGDNHSLLISKDGDVYSFGNGQYGQLGIKSVLHFVSVRRSRRSREFFGSQGDRGSQTCGQSSRWGRLGRLPFCCY
jgi:alpha-tubulin suppressor-like RCC1 family protein